MASLTQSPYSFSNGDEFDYKIQYFTSFGAEDFVSNLASKPTVVVYSLVTLTTPTVTLDSLT
jgi:hypothetical protein